MDVPKFPLTRLPTAAYKLVLRVMHFPQLLKYSWLSKKCKNVVKSFKMWPGNRISVLIHYNIHITIYDDQHYCSLNFYSDDSMNWHLENSEVRNKLKTPRSAEMTWQEKPNSAIYTTLENPDFHMNDWWEHLQAIFGNSQIHTLYFDDHSSVFDLDSIKQSFKNFRKLCVGSTSPDFNHRILKEFLPLEKIRIANDAFHNREIPSRVLVQNLHCFRISSLIALTLDDLLVMNSKMIVVPIAGNASKSLNRFIELWQKGSSPQLEFMHIFIDIPRQEKMEMVDIMKKITHFNFPMHRSRNFKSGSNRATVEGGMDIFSHDGTKATITIRHDGTQFLMYVWFDHCIVD